MALLASMLDGSDIDIDAEAWRKLDPALRRAVSEVGPDSAVELPVLIVLDQIVLDQPPVESSPRGLAEHARWLAGQERVFDEASAAVRRTIEEAGPFDLRANWLARAFAARLPVPVIEVVARRPEVRQVVLDVPHKLIQEPKGRHA